MIAVSKRTIVTIAIGNIFLVVGLCLFISILMSKDYYLCNNHKVAKADTATISVALSPTELKISGSPIRLILPSLDLNLEIVPGYYNSQTAEWNVSWDKVQFATITSEPNNISGNTLIYGHQSKGLFITLPKLKKGDLAIVKTPNNHTFYYRFSDVYTTNPLDSSVFDTSDKPVLKLLTCSGLLFQYRQIYSFEFFKVI